MHMVLYIPGGAGFLQKDGVSPRISLLRPVIKPKCILRKDPSSIYFPVILLWICIYVWVQLERPEDQFSSKWLDVFLLHMAPARSCQVSYDAEAFGF